MNNGWGLDGVMAKSWRELESEAFAAQRKKDYSTAAEIWLQIVTDCDNWEHGGAHFCLAGCYMNLGKIDEAIAHYKRASELRPTDSMFAETWSDTQRAKDEGLI
jgi:tetratricopeptide (TPR) repeat protein